MKIFKNYYLPTKIETLLALQEIGLTKIPKKTWADIGSESDDESEIDIKTLIQKAKGTKVICNSPKEKKNNPNGNTSLKTH